jgi:predicted Zn-dependent peptidase
MAGNVAPCVPGHRDRSHLAQRSRIGSSFAFAIIARKVNVDAQASRPQPARVRAVAGVLLGVATTLGMTTGVPAQTDRAAVHETVTDRGLRIWQFPDDGGERFLLAVLVGTGARDEDPEQTGIAHFLEHVLFASTATRPKAAQDRDLRARNVRWNGTTTHEHTIYYLETRPSDWRFAVEWLADHLLHPAFAAGDIDAERQIVFEEIDLRNPHAGAVTYESVLYPKHALGRSVGGDHQKLDRIGDDELRRFYALHYRPANMAIGFAGRVSRAECVAAITQLWSASAAVASAMSVDPVAPLTGAHVFGNPHDTADASGWLRAGFHVPVRDVRDLALLRVIASHLQQGFFEQIRERRQLAYAPQVDVRHYREVTRLSFHARVSDRGNLGTVLAVVDDLVSQLGSASEEELRQAKAAPHGLLVTNSLADLEDAMHVAWLMRTLQASPAQWAPVIDQVTVADVVQLAKKWLHHDHRFVLSNVALDTGMRAMLALALLLLVAIVVDGVTGFTYTRRVGAACLRLRPARRPAPRRQTAAPRAPMRGMSGDELAQRIQQYLDEEDRTGR